MADASTSAPADSYLAALRASHQRLRSAVEALDETGVRGRSYASKWSIADVLSHLGSGAEIGLLRLRAGLGVEDPDAQEQPQSIWDRWNSKTPDDQVADGLASDTRFLDELSAVGEEDRAGFETSLGPLALDFAGYLRLRLAEHAVHTWDVAVMAEPGAGIAPDAVELVQSHLPVVAGWAGKPTGEERTVRVHLTEPETDLVVALGAERVSITEGPTGDADVTMPAEAFVRLVYGRLDADHTPAAVRASGDALDALRRAFPGF